MIAVAMKMRQSGLSRKNMFVVPNSIVGQWEKIFTDLYPTAKVLAIEPKSFKPHMREKVLKQIRDADYDGIIIAYSCFEMIPLSVDYLMNDLNAKVAEIQKGIKDMTERLISTESLYREKAYLSKLTDELIRSIEKRDVGLTFDNLEINTLFLDEAHNYKNIPIRTTMKNLQGINTKGSSKCLDMMKKVRYVQEHNNGRGAVFATGTPLCNSISDAYAMQCYLQHEEIKEDKLDRFDNWIKTFAYPEQVCEVDVDTSKFRLIRRFTRFFNLPELSRMFSQIAVFYAMDIEDGIPQHVGYSDVIIKKNKNLTSYMKALSDRTEAIRGKEVDRRQDNMLKVSTDGRKAALDLRLVEKEQSYDSYSKIYRCVEQTMEVYEKYPECTQLIFCDYSTPKKELFNVYDELKIKLVEKGIPKEEIAFVHSYHTESSRLKLFDKVNKGIIRILIGSTFKLGIGTNVQTKLKAVHHLDVPWRPADMIQREGRILRKGNENEDVYIYRYIAENSFDAYSWQILENKQRFITDFLKGSAYQRQAADLDNNVLTYAEVKALALSQPLMKQLAEKENELNHLQILCNKEAKVKKDINAELETLPERIDKIKQRLKITICLTYLNLKLLFQRI